MRYEGEEKKIPLSPIAIIRLILLFFIPIISYGLALVPAIFYAYILLKYLDLTNLLHLVAFSILLVFGYLILCFSSIFSSAFFINTLSLKYNEGVYGKSLEDKTAFKFALYFALYYPTYKLLNIFVLPPLKSFFLSLIGCKIGKMYF